MASTATANQPNLAPAPEPTTAAPSTAVAKRSPMATLAQLLESKKDQLALQVPKHLTAERLIKVALSAVSRQPKLLECTPESVYLAVMQAAQLGLEPNLLGACYLVPFNNKKKIGGREEWVTEAQFIPGYRGLIDLARRSGQIDGVEAHVVYEKDTFRVSYGLEPMLEHTPYLGDEDAGRVKLVYAIGRLKGAAPQVEVMTFAQVERIRMLSKAKDSGPWKDHWGEMARKTVVKRLMKYLPLSVELVQALEADSRFEDAQNRFDPVASARTFSAPSKVAELPAAHDEPIDVTPALESDEMPGDGNPADEWADIFKRAPDIETLQKLGADLYSAIPDARDPVRVEATKLYSRRAAELGGGGK